MEAIYETFGRLHPVLVHLPVGFILIMILIEVLKWLRMIRMETSAIAVLWFFTFLSSFFSALAGYLLSLEGGYEAASLALHRNQGIALTALCLLVFFARWPYLTSKTGINALLYSPAVLATGILVIITGHNGGNLTHGESYLTEKLPVPVKKIMGIAIAETQASPATSRITDMNEAVAYKEVIRPIIEEKCVSCHGAKKMKGELRMDTPQLLLKGGEHGPVLASGQPDESEMIKRILLPESSDEHMPPKGKPQITAEELTLLQWWVRTGHDFNKRVIELEKDPEVAALLKTGNAPQKQENSSQAPVFSEEASLLKQEFPEVPALFSDKIREAGGVLTKISKASNLVDITFFSKPGLNDKEFGALGKLPEQILWLNLAGTKIGTETIRQIAGLPNLTRLHLERTGLKGEALNDLLKLPRLEYLNLNGNPVSVKDIEMLAGIKSLKSLYIFDTGISEDAINTLKSKYKKLKIESGPGQKQIEEFLKQKGSEVSDDVYSKK